MNMTKMPMRMRVRRVVTMMRTTVMTVRITRIRTNMMITRMVRCYDDDDEDNDDAVIMRMKMKNYRDNDEGDDKKITR